MKFTVSLLVVTIVAGIVSARSTLHRFTQHELDAHFEQFKFTHNRNYGTPEEETLRKDIFSSNLDLILHHNSQAQLGLHSFTLGVNRFADLTNSEFRAQLLNSVPFNQTVSALTVDQKLRGLPDSVDWTQKGMVTPVKDQGQCGSVVAFASVAAIESAHAIKTGKLVSLSEAQIEDCCGSNSGCQGSAMSDDDAFKCVIKMGGIDTESSYPTPSSQCAFNPKNVGATISAFVDIKAGCEDALQAAVALSGPVAVEIDASQASFQFYMSGVYDDPACSSTVADHAVTVVGYGTDGGAEFWKAKNSWGASWGEQGYIRMSRNKKNQCGIASLASYPVV